MQNAVKIIFGVDEVGRGPLAGPVMAVAITCRQLPITNYQFPNKFQISNFKFQNGFKDSKKLSQKQREKIYNLLKQNKNVQWGIGKVSEKAIDKINIFQATKMAMEKAVLNLEKKIGQQANLLLIDGNFGIGLNRPQKSIIKGDEKVPLIGLASIVAKVERDKLMTRLHKKYPQYGFNQHKGYGTQYHFAMISQFGVCKIHRQSFRLTKLKI